MHDYCTAATNAHALKRLAVFHYINTCVDDIILPYLPV